MRNFVKQCSGFITGLPWRKILLFLDSLFFLTGTVCFGFSYGITRLRGHLSIDQILFHLRLRNSGISSDSILHIVLPFWWIILIEISFVLLFFHFLRRIWCQSADRSKELLHITIFSFFIGVMGLFYSMHTHDIFTYLRYRNCTSNFLDQNYYVAPKITPSYRLKKHWWQPRRPNNLVLIVCESMEQTFANPEHFDENLIPELTQLQQQNIALPSLRQIHGAQFTLASLYSILYGLPLLDDASLQKDSTSHNLLPSATSLMNILEKSGYKLCFMQGGTLEFAGKRHIFDKTKCELLGTEELMMKSQNPQSLQEHVQAWGISDTDMLAMAREKLTQLGNRSKPFCLILLTLDTHAGHTLDSRYTPCYNDPRDIIRQESRLLGEFVHWIQQQPYAEKTTIALTGDHGMMIQKLADVRLDHLDWNTERALYGCLINPVSWLKPRTKGRTFSNLDWPATLLEAIGFFIPKSQFGLGHSIFGTGETILDKLGIDGWREESQKNSIVYQELLREKKKKKRKLWFW